MTSFGSRSDDVLPLKHALSSWTSPHLLDCQKLDSQKMNAANAANDNTKSIFVTTKTTTPFQMSIHNPANVPDEVSSYIKKNGCWECDHIKKMTQALSSNEDSYLLDIGGNIGMWTLAAAAANKHTFTIEPSQNNFHRICETVNKNSFNDRVHLMTIAATDTPQVFSIAEMRGNLGGTQVKDVSPDDAAALAAKDSAAIIKGVPIDSLKLPTDRPVVMKVDVEGHELQALLGALEFLQLFLL